ncbi:hypothetical protein [Exiguobacterium undae]|uniref:Uncharacterized protein n=1 Tax=Exiguobacterium undae TaxID=169177 RepID=A0ABX2V8G2_9BACL|nr:hypothetical protein [Exiguobacterium undae]OAN13859.1 hypothetical protein A3783_16315 [Exiguobacterium undae]
MENSLNVFLTLTLLTILYTTTSFFITTRRREKDIPLKRRYLYNFLYKVSLYIAEILLMFSLFAWLTDYFKVDYEEEGKLKQFIDFFTVYQIFIFAVLNLYDSLKKEVHISLIHQIEYIQLYLEANKNIDKEIEKVKHQFSNEKRLQYDDIDISENKEVTKLIASLEKYNENRESNSELASDAKFEISLQKNELNERKERIDSLWNISLFLRFFTVIYSKKEAPDNL